MPTPIKVLLLEDSDDDARLNISELRQAGFVPEWKVVDTEADFLTALESPFDLILSDFNMPQFDSMRALRIIRERGMDTPFIIVSGSIGEDIAVTAMRQGATDYLIKDRLGRLGQAVTQALENRRIKLQQRELEATLHLRDRAIASLAQGVLITDPAQPGNPIIYANPGFERLTGYTQAEVLGRNCKFLQGPATDPHTVQKIAQTVRNQEMVQAEILNYRKDGKTFWNELIITPIRDATGRVTHFVGVQNDVTDRKKLEEQFRQSQKMEAFGRLAGGVAHDFNNLLTIICGYSDLVLGTLPDKSPTREMLEHVKKAGERATGLTQQLLAFSRKQILQLEVLNLNNEVAEAKKLLGRLLGEDIELISEPDPEECLVKADRTQIQQVIVNLAVNARDAMPKGGKLTMVTRTVDLDEAFTQSHPSAHIGPHVLLEVSDTGCGMPPEVLARIFEPFFTTKEVGKGTGLGLATVFGIVEQSNGFVEVESKPEQGTLFRIYLPRTTVLRPVKMARPSSSGLRRGGETIFVVEDDDGVRSLATMILRSSDYTVLEARDGENALEVFGQHNGPIHLLLTDVVMPRMDGCRLAELLAAKAPGLKVLYMSGYLDDAIVRHGIQEKKLPFLQKPFTPDSLIGRVREVLDVPKEVVP